ncbi:MAG TPA: competence/damage-inducible protein A [Terriglobales bacterium]|nr:competence/damage-inducible protein A [Terriglobales bacterium]
MIAEIIAVGSEMLTPFRQDTNSLFLTSRLNALGVEVAYKTIVGDSREQLVDVARTALGRSNVLVFSGGLGPTEDDLTRESVAEALGIELQRDPDLVAELYARFAQRRIKMPENNLKQAEVLGGAEIIRNPRGSAPAQWLEGTHLGQQRIIILLPGPPWELEPLFREEFEPRLRAVLPEAFIATRELKVAMMGESAADLKAAPIYKKHKDVQTTILAGAGEVQFHLKASGETMAEAQEKVDTLANELEDALDDAVFSSAGESLEQIVGYYLQMRGATLATAESCTGGLLAERLTRISGSSRYFVGGAVVYSNELKKLFCDVPPLMIAEHGAVSKEVAAAMAEGIRKKCKATLGIGITGVAGPTGGTELKPVGLVYIALADGVTKTEVVERKYLGDRDRIRHWASQQALDMIRKKLV